MKKLALLGMSIFLLGACGNNVQEEVEADTESSSSEEIAESATSGTITVNSDAPTEVETVGQTTKKFDTDFTLKKISKIDGTASLAEGLDLTFDDLKIYQMGAVPSIEGEDELNQKIQEQFDRFGIKEGDYFLEIKYHLANKTDQDLVDPYPSQIFTTTGEEVDTTKIESEGSYDLAKDAGANFEALYKLKDPEIKGVTLHFDIKDNELFETVATEPVDVNF